MARSRPSPIHRLTVAAPPPSGDPCQAELEATRAALAGVTAERDAARVDRDRLAATLAQVRARVAAVGQAIPAALADALEG